MGDQGDRPPMAPRTPSSNIDIAKLPMGNYVVTVDDPASWETWMVMGQVVGDILAQSPRLLVLDLTGLDSLDLPGVGALSAAAAQAGESDIAFCLVGAQDGPVRAAVADAGLTELFELFESVRDALHGF